jgi:hypothetical protein
VTWRLNGITGWSSLAKHAGVVLAMVVFFAVIAWAIWLL